MIHVPDAAPDGEYLLELQVANFVNDAAPSRPVLYALLCHDAGGPATTLRFGSPVFREDTAFRSGRDGVQV
jgi:hypothetical protein